MRWNTIVIDTFIYHVDRAYCIGQIIPTHSKKVATLLRNFYVRYVYWSEKCFTCLVMHINSLTN